MRLIDADAIEHRLLIGGRRHGKTIISEIIRRAIQTAPTVDAIPVEFIKEEIKNTKGFYSSNLRRLLDTWAERKEE